jgi:hypothetical protein
VTGWRLEDVTEGAERRVGPPAKEVSGLANDPAAIALGRKGGLKDGLARARKPGKKKARRRRKKGSAS